MGERASVVPPSSALPVAFGHAIRVESVSDCHDGRWVGRAEEVWAFNTLIISYKENCYFLVYTMSFISFLSKMP